MLRSCYNPSMVSVRNSPGGGLGSPRKSIQKIISTSYNIPCRAIWYHTTQTVGRTLSRESGGVGRVSRRGRMRIYGRADATQHRSIPEQLGYAPRNQEHLLQGRELHPIRSWGRDICPLGKLLGGYGRHTLQPLVPYLGLDLSGAFNSRAGRFPFLRNPAGRRASTIKQSVAQGRICRTD